MTYMVLILRIDHLVNYFIVSAATNEKQPMAMSFI